MSRNVHILGSVQNIKIARDAVVSLILGSPPGMFPLKLLAHADVYRKGLRSFEICWSEAQAAILDFCLGYRFGVYVLIFGFSACSNDYLYAFAITQLFSLRHNFRIVTCLICSALIPPMVLL